MQRPHEQKSSHAVAQSARSKQMYCAISHTLRLIIIYLVCDCIIIMLYPAAKIYSYLVDGGANVGYQIHLLAGSLVSLQILWVCFLADAFSQIAVGNLPVVAVNKEVKTMANNQRHEEQIEITELPITDLAESLDVVCKI